MLNPRVSELVSYAFCIKHILLGLLRQILFAGMTKLVLIRNVCLSCWTYEAISSWLNEFSWNL